MSPSNFTPWESQQRMERVVARERMRLLSDFANELEALRDDYQDLFCGARDDIRRLDEHLSPEEWKRLYGDLV